MVPVREARIGLGYAARDPASWGYGEEVPSTTPCDSVINAMMPEIQWATRARTRTPGSSLVIEGRGARSG